MMRGVIRNHRCKSIFQRQLDARLWEGTEAASRWLGSDTQQSLPFHRLRSRTFSSTKLVGNGGDDSNSDMRPDIAFILEHYKIHRREKEGTNGSSREYLLLPPDVYVPQVLQDPSLPAAALFAHNNILFGARSFHGYDMEDVCLPLVRAAIEDSEFMEQGQQPQAVASLKGLSQWVAACFDQNLHKSETLQKLYKSEEEQGNVSFEAVRAIATGVPRPGHSVVGQGTFRDGQAAWMELGREYVSLGLSEESNLYEKEGGNLVNIEHMADQSIDNMKSAGGAMARLFFL